MQKRLQHPRKARIPKRLIHSVGSERMKRLAILLVLAICGCAPPHTMVTYHAGGYGTLEPWSYSVDPARFDRFWTTRVGELDGPPWTNGTHIVTVAHRGHDIRIIWDDQWYEKDGYAPSPKLYAQMNGRYFSVPSKWICELPLLAKEAQKGSMRRLEASKE